MTEDGNEAPLFAGDGTFRDEEHPFRRLIR